MKLTTDHLAVFGGSPAFGEPLHVGRPNLGNRERLFQRINRILDTKWLTNDGPYVHEFEHKICGMLGVKHCIAICNGTIALQIAIRAAGLSGEVIVPSFTFVATAHALEWQNITPVFCDIDPRTHNIDPSQIEEVISPRTTGIIGVHLWGRPCDPERVLEIGKRHNLRVLFDAAHAFGCSYRGRMIGNFGDCEVFSFHATKIVNSLEGGAAVTNDDELANKIRLMRSFGFADYDDVIHCGTNGKMNEVSGAMGLTSLESLEEFVAMNYRNYEHYRLQLTDIPGVRVLTYDENERCNFQYVVLEIDEAISGISRDELQVVLWAENVLARRYFFPGCHRIQPYRSHLGDGIRQLPATEGLSMRVLCLPTGTSVGLDHIDEICQIVRLVFQHRHEVGRQLRRLIA